MKTMLNVTAALLLSTLAFAQSALAVDAPVRKIYLDQYSGHFAIRDTLPPLTPSL